MPATRFSIIWLFILFIFQACDSPDKKTAKDPKEGLSGEELAKGYCASCHMFTEPSLMDKETWKYGILPQMGHRMGIYGSTPRESLIEKNAGGRLVQERNIFPEQPMVTEKQWQLINEYFYREAPANLEVPEKQLVVGVKNLEVEIPEFHIPPPLITAIKHNPDLNQVFVADVKSDYCTINVLDKDLNSLSTLALPHPISHIDFRGDSIMATMMGGFMPTDEPSGSVVKIFKVPGSGDEYKGFKKVLTNLQRPVHSSYSDLTGDGIEDIVVCEYGNHTGKLSLFIGVETGAYGKKILSYYPGATTTEIKDLNKDGLPDIIALMAQGRERIDAYFNKGNGEFSVKTLLRFSPIYGSVSFKLVDWNQDGHDDIIYVNGDNADYSRSFKPYHGLRIYLNDGENSFKEAFFQHQNGAYRAVPYDFDQDGDLDIALSSFFPDLVNQPEEGFVFMENVSTSDSIQFELKTFKEASSGRWLIMETADLNQDNFPELLLGSFVGMDVNGDTDGRVGQNLIQNSPTLIKLNFKK